MVQTPLRFLMFAVAGAAMIVNEALLKKSCEFCDDFKEMGRMLKCKYVAKSRQWSARLHLRQTENPCTCERALV